MLASDWCGPPHSQTNLVYSIARIFFGHPSTNFRIFNLRKDFNWNQFTFNWNQFTFNWFQFTFNWNQFTFNWCQFTFNWCQFTFNWNQFTFNWNQFTFNWFQFNFNWFQFTFNWFQFIFNWFQFTFNWFQSKGISITQRKVEKGFCFFHSQKLLCTIGYHPNNYIIEDLSHSWGTTFKNCLGAVFWKGFNKASNYWENLAF